MQSIIEYNWNIIFHLYKDHVALVDGILKNIKLPQRHFDALCEVIWLKKFYSWNMLRKDDSLRNAVGNWLYTRKYGSWRIPNRAMPYKENNKELWQNFCDETIDYSMSEAIVKG
jgi:hypothetical protein